MKKFAQEASRPTAHSGRLGRRVKIFGLSLTGGVALALMTATSAFGVTGCRSDPVVTLSNGARVRLVTYIGTNASDVSNVSYSLKVPQGLSVTSVWSDNGPVPDTFSWTASNPPVGPNGNAQVTAQTQVSSHQHAPATLIVTAADGAVESVNQANGNTDQWINQNLQLQSSGNSTCLGDSTLTGTLSQNLIVPTGVACTVNNLTVDQNVQVQPGGSLVATDLTVGHDLQVQQAGSVQFSGGSVDGTAQLQGLTTGSTALCGVTMAHDLVVQQASTSVSLTLGDPSNGCAANTIGGQLRLQKDAGTLTANGNTIAGDAVCPNDTWSSDSFSGNSVGGNDNGC